MVMFAVCDANYCFIAVDIGAYGREGDASIFASSQFAKYLDNGCLGIPGQSTLVYSDSLSPYVFVMVMFYSVTCSFKYSTLTNNFAFLLG
jgi:hypothetical protein